MPIKFPFPLTPRFSQIRKLTSSPVSSIRKWLTEKRKTLTPNPMKPYKKKIVKDKKIHIPNLQKVIIQISQKINEIIDNLNGIAEIEKMIIAEVRQRQDEISRLEIEDIRIETKLTSDLRKLRTDHTNKINTLETNLNRRLTRHSEKIGGAGGHSRSGLGYTTSRNFNVAEHGRQHVEQERVFEEHEEKFIEHKYKKLQSSAGDTSIHNIGNRSEQQLETVGYEMGGKTKPVLTSKEDFKKILINEILELQNEK